MSLKVRTARGSMMMAIVTFGMRPIVMIISVFLLRLLDPEDFGLIALAFILFNTANLFTDLGMGPAVVQSKLDIRKVAFFAFVITTGFSLLVYVGVFFAAQPIATLLGGGSDLVPILQVMGVVVVLDGLRVVPEALLKRELMFKQLAISQIPSQFVYGGVAIILALRGYGVWALVVATIASEVVTTGMVWALQRGWFWLRPHRYDREIVSSLIRFGVPSMTSGLLRYFHSHWDDWLVGRRLGTAALGLYSRAYDLTTTIVTTFGNAVFGFVLMPSYAKMQDDKERLTRAYLKSTRLVFLAIVPISLGIFIVGPETIRVLLNEKWVPMIPVWQIFALYGLTRPVSANASPLFLAVGRPSYNVYNSLVLLAFMVPMVLLLIGPYGIVGVAVAVSVSHLIAVLFNIYQVEKILPGTAIETFKNAVPFFAAGLVMVLVVYLAEAPVKTMAGGENLVSLISLVVIGFLVYTALIFLLQRDLMRELIDLFVKAVGLDRRLQSLPFARFQMRK